MIVYQRFFEAATIALQLARPFTQQDVVRLILFKTFKKITTVSQVLLVSLLKKENMSNSQGWYDSNFYTFVVRRDNGLVMVYYQSLLRTYNYVESRSDSNLRKSKRRDNVLVDYVLLFYSGMGCLAQMLARI
jgi:hypothetical protein